MTSILGPARCSAAQAAEWARSRGAELWFCDLTETFWEECWVVGVRADVAFAQACKETGFGRFGGVIDASFHNTCGLKTRAGGSNSDPDAHARFPDWRTGIRAHVHHLHLYARGPLDPTPDPRHFPHLAGTATSVEALSGKWAPSTTYHEAIVAYVEEMTVMTKLGFTIHWNGPPANCVGQPHRRCVAFFDAVKRYHGQKFGEKWAATSLYSFGVCPHGLRFTGCGWNMNQAANGRDEVGADDGRDSQWYTVIVFLGEGEKPTPEMVEGVRRLIDDGRLSRRCGARVLPHNAFKRKTCPGPEFTALARAWDNAPLYVTTPSTEEDIMAADPRGAARICIREFLGRSPETYTELDFHAGEIQRLGLNGYIEWLEAQPEAQAWAKKIGAEVRSPDPA